MLGDADALADAKLNAEPNAEPERHGNGVNVTDADSLGHAEPDAVRNADSDALAECLADDDGECDPDALDDADRLGNGDAHQHVYVVSDSERLTDAEPQHDAHAVGRPDAQPHPDSEPHCLSQSDTEQLGGADPESHTDPERNVNVVADPDHQRDAVALVLTGPVRERFRDGHAECVADGKPSDNAHRLHVVDDDTQCRADSLADVDARHQVPIRFADADAVCDPERSRDALADAVRQPDANPHPVVLPNHLADDHAEPGRHRQPFTDPQRLCDRHGKRVSHSVHEPDSDRDAHRVAERDEWADADGDAFAGRDALRHAHALPKWGGDAVTNAVAAAYPIADRIADGNPDSIAEPGPERTAVGDGDCKPNADGYVERDADSSAVRVVDGVRLLFSGREPDRLSEWDPVGDAQWNTTRDGNADLGGGVGDAHRGRLVRRNALRDGFGCDGVEVGRRRDPPRVVLW